MTYRIRRASSALWTALWLPACTGAGARVPSPSHNSAAVSPSERTPTAPALPASPASASAPTPAPASANVDTRMRIACGTAACDAHTQSCIDVPEWHCAPRATPSDSSRHDCDDASDCAPNQTCCLSFASGGDYHVCSARNGDEADCRLELCAPGGAACPAGQACVDGVCRAATSPPRCGRRRCSRATPICAWANGAERCVSLSGAERMATPETAVLRCTDPGDCGIGFRCCTNALWNATVCQLACDAANNGVVCHADGDCPRAPGGARMKCSPLSADPERPRGLPGWLGVCRA